MQGWHRALLFVVVFVAIPLFFLSYLQSTSLFQLNYKQIQPQAFARAQSEQSANKTKQNTPPESPLSSMLKSVCPRGDMSVAIVMPFIENQLAEVEKNLRSWAKYFPCSSQFAHSFRGENSDSPLPWKSKVRFYFYFNNGHEQRIEQAITAIWKEIENETLTGAGQEVRLKECFADNAPQILWADLQEQRLNHLIGSSRMFNKVFDLLGERNVDYWFYMEPDTIPVRANWVEKIFHEAVCGNEFWIKGSTFRKGQEWFFKHIGDHFNGNSLYNRHNPEFSSWVKEKISMRPNAAYDLVIAQNLKRDAMFFRDHIHLFLHVDWVFNYGSKKDSPAWKPWTDEELNQMSPSTYLVHGKKQ